MVAINWLHALLGMFLVTIIWILFTPVVFTLYDTASGMTTDIDALNTMGYLKIVWNAWPWVFVVGLIFYSIISSQKREYDTGVYS